jgi:NADH dehydrogenase
MSSLIGEDSPKTMVGSVSRSRPRIVIIGAGFGGLYAARALGGAPVRVIIVDRRNHHLFQPLLYQVATAGLASTDIASPVRRILHRYENIEVLLGEVVSIDPARQLVGLRDGELTYDYLIFAPGSAHDYFGHSDWERVSVGLKSLEDALELRRRILLAFEAAEREKNPELRQEHLTFAIIGAGPTGVELAGALREIAQLTLARDFRNFDPRHARVILIDAAERVLPEFPERLSHKAFQMLDARCVEVRTSCKVTALEQHIVRFGDEEIRARTIVWAAGVRASPLTKFLGSELDRQGRVKVAHDLSLPDYPDVFVVGDCAHVVQDGRIVPMLAPVAIQAARCAAASIKRDLTGQPRKAFRYRDRGVLSTIGRKAAVARIGRVSLSGSVAWFAWVVVHILWLIGFRNRLAVMLEWIWAYFTFQHGARVILNAAIGSPSDGSGVEERKAAAQEEPAVANCVASSDLQTNEGGQGHHG